MFSKFSIILEQMFAPPEENKILIKDDNPIRKINKYIK